jgi:uncharacterized Zn finger protein (UPF0148 family)
MTRWICWLIGHLPFLYDVRPDGTKIRYCPRCETYVVRDTADPRPRVPNADARFRLTKREQASARWTALRRLRETPKSENADVVQERYRA